MTIRDDAMKIMRQELGAGFESATFAVLQREYLKSVLKPKLKALYLSRVDMTSLVAARVAAEQALRDEQVLRDAEVRGTENQLNSDLESL